MDSYDILVIILSTFLAIFIALAIFATALVIKLLKSLQQIVEKGEQLVDTAEEIGNTIRRNAGATALLKLLLSFVNNSTHKTREK